ncbi:MAG: cache domain-containing protein [Magnetospirillum sp.]|nr:cache domain-containing protein [Magnetospirillum sp.]
MFIDNWRVRAKILLIVAASLAGMVLMVALGLSNLRAELVEGRRIKTQQLVEVARGLVGHYVAEAKAGSMTTEAAQAAALAALKPLRYSGSEYFWVNDMRARMIMHPIKPELDGKELAEFKDPAGKKLFTAFVEEVARNKAGFVDYLWPKPGHEEPVPKVSYVMGVEEWGWVVGSGIYIDDVDAAFWRAVTNQGILIAMVMVVVLGISYLVGHRIVGALATISQAMHRLAEGDTSVTVALHGRKDEIGEMSQSIEVFRKNAIEVQSLHDEQERLRLRAEQDRHATLANLAEELERGVSSAAQAVNAAAAQMRSTATAMTGTADRTSEESQVVAAAVSQTTANVETVAAAAEELNASIGEISRQVGQSTGIARNAVEAARRTDSVVRGLSEAAARIGEVVSMINGIAGQTNLLALNATIEAARAGEAGKGFAVVANEVKHLANQTAKATDEISAQIAAIQGTSNDAVQAIQDIGRTIESMSAIAESIAQAVEQQGAATHEIARNVAQAATGANEVANHIGAVTQAAGETGSAAREVLAAADLLARDAANMKSGLDRFLLGVRGM